MRTAILATTILATAVLYLMWQDERQHNHSLCVLLRDKQRELEEEIAWSELWETAYTGTARKEAAWTAQQ